MYVSSPIESPIEVLVGLGKFLKENNAAVNVINLITLNVGSEADNTEKIDEFVGAVNYNES